MTTFLKQSTAVTIEVGPFLAAADAVTPETALTITQPDIRLSKNGGSFAQKSASGTASHMENGYYSVSLSTTDTNTLGRLRLHVNESGALPVWLDFMVLPANVYDSLVAGSDNLEIDLVQWRGTQPNNLVSNRVDASVGALAAAVITAASIASDAIQAAKIQDGALTAAKFASDFFTSVKTQVVNALTSDTYAEPGAVPAATSSLKDKIGWLFTLARNKRLTSETTDTVRNDADDADIASAGLNDDGTTFTRDEWA